MKGDPLGAVSGDVGEEGLFVSDGKGGEVVLVVFDVEIPVPGEVEEREVLEGARVG